MSCYFLFRMYDTWMVIQMIVEIVSTGTELLLGQIVNTNAQYLARHLNTLGFDVLYQTVVGDNRERMEQVIKNALDRADLVITSGGLGPTQGDITKEVTAKVFERSIIIHEPSLDRIKAYFIKRKADMPPNNIRQAMLPEGAVAIANENGTAPGVILEHNNKIIINLPGPPHELEAMFSRSVIPYLQSKFGIQGIIISRTLHTVDIGESSLEEKIADLVKSQTNPTIALLARKGEVQIRLTAKSETENDALKLISKIENVICERVGEYIFGIDDQTMESVVSHLLIEKNLSIALAESCTGGLVTSRITDVPGSSRYLIGSVICYNNRVKTREIGVPEEIIVDYGAVSKETAKAMAIGIRTKFMTDIGVGITGIAGPGGATDKKPTGLVFIAIDGNHGSKCFRYNFSGERTDIKYRASQMALDIIRRYALTDNI